SQCHGLFTAKCTKSTKIGGWGTASTGGGGFTAEARGREDGARVKSCVYPQSSWLTAGLVYGLCARPPSRFLRDAAPPVKFPSQYMAIFVFFAHFAVKTSQCHGLFTAEARGRGDGAGVSRV